MREKYGVEMDVVGDYSVFPMTEWYAKGYNSVSRPLLVQKFGRDIFAECWTLAAQQWAAERPRK
jgi:hypothetical protein